MFTRFVLWLLVACIPALLMLATLGLGRLEKSLADDTVTASDVADFLNHAEAVDVRTLAREGMPEALELLHRRQALGLEAAPQPRALNGGITSRLSLLPIWSDVSNRACPPASGLVGKGGIAAVRNLR